MIPESLDRIMTEWDVSLKGRKPKLMYTIPVGQNPTGSCPPAERYDAIYALCQKVSPFVFEDLLHLLNELCADSSRAFSSSARPHHVRPISSTWLSQTFDLVS